MKLDTLRTIGVSEGSESDASDRHSDTPILHYSHTSSGFTLIELMVVVFVIALLLSLVATGVRRARELAMKTQCQNNLREHGVALCQLMLTGEASADLTGKKGGYGQVSKIVKSGSGGGIIYKRYEDGYVGELAWAALGYDGFSGDSGGKSLSSSGSGYGDYLDFVIDPEVKHCPSVDFESFIDTNLPSFKGYRTTTTEDTTTYWDYTFTVTNRYNTDIAYITNTTYAQNPYGYSGTSTNVIAYIDWNAEQGWNGTLYYTTWMFSNPDKGIVQGTSKGTTNWCKTEVGFHHLGGANFVAWDGHVGWVSSNDIDLSYFQ